jgi:hypothetical protein
MALPTASDNPFPSILLEDHADPAAPTSGFHRLFVDTDEKLKMIDHASLVTDFTPGASVATINFVIDGGGSAITTGIKGDILVDFACVVNAWTLLADASGAIVVDIWKDTLGNFPPTNADAMPGGGKEPAIAASGTNATDTAITDWTTDDIAAGDILRFNVDSCATITRATLALKVTRV